MERPNQQKIRLMTRLAMLEKTEGKELGRVSESFKSDYVGIPMLKNGLRITAVFLLILGIWCVCHIQFLLDVTAEGELTLFGTGVLAAYLAVLIITLAVTFLQAIWRYRRSSEAAREYEELLDELAHLI